MTQNWKKFAKIQVRSGYKALSSDLVKNWEPQHNMYNSLEVRHVYGPSMYTLSVVFAELQDVIYQGGTGWHGLHDHVSSFLEFNIRI